MSERRSRILALVAETYIERATPVPSAWIADRLGVSGATVRSEFAALEEAGLLAQPHTSAGRLPTAEGFRRYAGALLPPRPLAPSLRQRLATHLAALHGRALLDGVAATASDLAGYAVVLELPADPDVRALEVHLSPLSSGRVLAVAVLENGLTRDALVPIDPAPSADVLDETERLVRDLALPLPAMPDALRARARSVGDGIRRTLDALADAWPTLHETEIVSRGLSRLFDEPESADPGFLRRATRRLERGGRGAPEGGSDDAGPLALGYDEDVALVHADVPLHHGLGRLTLVGPARMRYAEAFSAAQGVRRALHAAGGAA